MDNQSFIGIDKIIDRLDIKQNMVVADFGAGHGFFSVAMAKKVGPSGQIFAIDVLESAIEGIRSCAKLEGLFNIKPIRGDLEKAGGSTLPNDDCDVVIMANILFQAPDKAAVLNEAKRVLKPGGRLVLVEWRPYIGIGPKKEYRVTEEELKQMIGAAGFSNPEAIDAGSHHYGFIFLKP